MIKDLEMDHTNKIIAEIRAQIQKINTTHKAGLEKIKTANHIAIEKTIITNKAAVENINKVGHPIAGRTQPGLENSGLPPVPDVENNSEAADPLLNQVIARVDQAMVHNNAAGQEISAEIQHFIITSLENSEVHLYKAAEAGQTLLNQALLEVQELAETGIQESQKLMQQALAGSRSNVPLRNLSHRRASNKTPALGLRPSSLRKSDLLLLSTSHEGTLLENIERQISHIETDRLEKFSSILDEVKKKTADVQYELTQKEATYLNELSGKLDRMINQLYQDIFNLINNLSHDLKQAKSLKPQELIDLTRAAKSQILKLQSDAIKVCSKDFQALSRNNDAALTILIQKCESHRKVAALAAEQAMFEADQKLNQIKSENS
jgi:hypothetical protein